MKRNVVLLVQLFLFHNVLAQKGLQCFVPGECLDSQILDAIPVNNSKECWSHCQNVTGCTWFTFYKDSQICTPLSGCLRLSNEKCLDNCISGEEECPEVQCGIHGRCYGALEGIRKVGSAKECGSICESHQECFWNTYDPDHDSCLMTNDCPLLDRSCTNCSSSEQNCIAEAAEISKAMGAHPWLIGIDDKSIGRLFNMEMKTLDQCYLTPPHTKTIDWQFTTIGNELHVCSGAQEVLECFKFDNEKKTWIFMDRRTEKGGIYYLTLPNGHIVMTIKSSNLYVYNGEKIERVNGDPLPSTGSKRFCRTAISNDEILFGFALPIREQPQDGYYYTDFYSVDLKTSPATITKINVPKIEALYLTCGTFGPEDNRQVLIFGGLKVIHGTEMFGAGPVILDWKTKTLDSNGPSLNGVYTYEGHTIAFGDTFLFYNHDKDETKIYKFDINNNETNIPFVGSFPNKCSNLATISTDIPGCDVHRH